MTPSTSLIDAVLREDFKAFSEKVFSTVCPGEIYRDTWHVECLAWHLSQVRGGSRIRLIINLPPRSLKSLLTSIALPAWLLGHDPSARIIACSYADDLSKKLARDSRTVLEAPWYRRIFPATQAHPRKNTESEFATTRQGFRLATSVGGTLTGRGGNVLIIDDPIKPVDAESAVERRRVNDWYDATLFSRLDNKEAGAIILVMQRLHEDDLTGHLVDKGGFELLSLPAIATDDEEVPIGSGRTYHRTAGTALNATRESVETLDSIKASVGSRVFAAQYQQSPVPADGNLFKSAWIARYAEPPLRKPTSQIVQSWDTAAKLGDGHDYSVGTTWLSDGNKFFLLDVRRGRWEFPDLLRVVTAEAETHRVGTVLIEDANSGAALIQSLRQQSRLNVIGVKATTDKRTRAAQQSATFEAGRVFLPEAAPWLAEFEKELLGFPNSRHDDQVDSSVQFLQWANERNRSGVVLQGPIIVLARNDEWRVPSGW